MHCTKVCHTLDVKSPNVLSVLSHAESPRDHFPRPFPRRHRCIRHTDSTLLCTRHSRFIVQWLKLAHTPAEPHHSTDIWHTGQTDRDMLSLLHHIRQERHSRESRHLREATLVCFQCPAIYSPSSHPLKPSHRQMGQPLMLSSLCQAHKGTLTLDDTI